MSLHYVYASDDGDEQPYAPASSGRGPFFSCYGKKETPHFHVVDGHPDIENNEGLNIRQMHVPGYDQHDGNVKTNFSTMPPYHIITGWHIIEPNTNSHITQLSATKKYSTTTDANEALDLWKEECTNVHGPGAFIKRPADNAKDPSDIVYDFLPGKEQPKEREEQEQDPEQEPEEQEQQEQQEQEKQQEQEQQQEQQKQQQQVPFGLKPGEKAYSIVFHPSKQMKSRIRPSFSRTKIFEGHNNSSESQNSLLNYADKLDMNSIIQNYKKSEENPDIWEELYKNSKKNKGRY